MGGAIYTVEAVSERLGVPRPTLYRYLKEYSIPYQRLSGRISIPDESVERIRRVRELHDEGLGTAAVRKRVQEGDTAEVDRISERLDQLSEALESSQRKGTRSVENVSSRQALHIILARQSVMLQAIYNLNEMVEELMAVNGRPRRPSADLLDDTAVRSAFPPDDILEVPPFAGNGAAWNAPGSSPATLSRQAEPADPAPAYRRDGFGTLARKRRRNALALTVLLVLVLCAVAWFVFVMP